MGLWGVGRGAGVGLLTSSMEVTLRCSYVDRQRVRLRYLRVITLSYNSGLAGATDSLALKVRGAAESRKAGSAGYLSG